MFPCMDISSLWTRILPISLLGGFYRLLIIFRLQHDINLTWFDNLANLRRSLHDYDTRSSTEINTSLDVSFCSTFSMVHRGYRSRNHFDLDLSLLLGAAQHRVKSASSIRFGPWRVFAFRPVWCFPSSRTRTGCRTNVSSAGHEVTSNRLG